jgi:hypothetical protein
MDDHVHQGGRQRKGREGTEDREGGAGRWREGEEGKEKRALGKFFMFKKIVFLHFVILGHHVDVAVSSAAAFENLMERGGR